jgi:Cft2 family RNA processing exonuclease
VGYVHSQTYMFIADVGCKSTTDLLLVVQDTALQNALMHAPQTTHPSLPASTAPLQAILNANVNLAAQLKSLEAHVQSQRQSTQARLLSLKALERQWAAKQAEQDAALEPFGPRTLYQRLTAAVSEQESICKGIEESWLDERDVADEREVSEWIKQIRESRKIAWIRRERKERWDEGRVGGWR